MSRLGLLESRNDRVDLHVLRKLSIRQNDQNGSTCEYLFDLREKFCFSFIQRDHWNFAFTGERWMHPPVTATGSHAEQPVTTIFSGSTIY